MNNYKCCICGSSCFKQLFEEYLESGDVLYVKKCECCGLIGTIPQPSDQFLENLYRNMLYDKNTVSGVYCLPEESGTNDHKIVTRALKQYASGQRLLDFGCGAGSYIGIALESGWDAYGTEPSFSCAGTIAKERYGNRILIGDLSSSDYAFKSFDVITLWYVLEHVKNPSEIIEQVSKYLKPNGILFIAVPNAHYVLLKRKLIWLLTGKAGTVHPYEHLHQYTPSTLELLLQKHRIKIIKNIPATPYYHKSNMLVRGGKLMSSIAVKSLYYLTGLNYGGILSFCKNENK